MNVIQRWRRIGVWYKITIIVVVCMALAGGAVFGWFTVQNAPYRNNVARYSQGVRDALRTASESLQQVSSTDSEAHSAALDSLAATFDQKSKEAPSAPHMLGISLGVETERTKVSSIQTAIDQFVAKLKEESQFITYQAGVAHDLQALSLKDATNFDQIMAVAGEWQQTKQKLEQLARPAKLADVSATLLQKMTEIHDVLVRLADLHRARDEAGFTAKYQELRVIVDSFAPLATQITQAAKDLDTELAQAVAVLQQKL